ncbi:hypothetical protein TH47_01615 [Thalassospira sp. MCCC 1A02803]|nr:hypothetical protein TH47_01615 [Thalassospira sp. MCCC 1A02803]
MLFAYWGRKLLQTYGKRVMKTQFLKCNAILICSFELSIQGEFICKV